MNLMLAVIFSCIGLGLVTRRCGAREQAAILGIAVAMTALYYVFAARFMK